MRHYFAAVFLLLACAARVGAQDTSYVPSKEYPNGKQLVAVYFGANWCAPCRKPAMKAAVQQMKPLLAAQAKQSGAEFAAIAVVLDRDLKSGLEFVAPLGAFDEYVFGSDLTSTAAQRFIWDSSEPLPMVPQVLVFERTVHVERNKPMVFSPDHVLRRVAGDSIPIWVKSGAPIR